MPIKEHKMEQRAKLNKKQIWEKSVRAFEEKYGKNWRKIVSKFGTDALKKKYGEKWFDVTLKKGRDKLREKYGENWQKHLSDLAMKSLKKKYGKNFHTKIRNMQKIYDGVPLTKTENSFTDSLDKLQIPHKTHHVKEEMEFDVVIPNIQQPKIVCEISTISPSTYAIRRKLIQILYQKKLFPKALHICILKKVGITKSGNKTIFNPDIIKFILDKGIMLFWIEQLKEVPTLIKRYLEGKTDVFNSQIQKLLDEVRKEEKVLLRNSKAGAITQATKINKYEKALNNILLNLKVNPVGAKVLKTKYGGYVAVDNFEELGKTKIIYEITSTKQRRPLSALAGKLAYLKRSIKNLKSIAILTNIDKLSNKVHDKQIKFAADVIVLKNEFNEKGLRKARSTILQA